MVGKEALLLKKELEFENLSEDQPGHVPNGVGFNGESSEVRKLRGVNVEGENSKPQNATFDRLVYDTQPPSNESILF